MIYRVLLYAGHGDPLCWNSNEKNFVPYDSAHSTYSNCSDADMWARYAKRKNTAIADGIFIRASRR